MATANKPNPFIVKKESVSLIMHKNIFTALKSFKADTPEKKIALEFINSYIDFIKEIVNIDNHRGIIRTEFEVKDLLSHVNILLQKKDEYVFNSMVVKSPDHYKAFQTHSAASSKTAKN